MLTRSTSNAASRRTGLPARRPLRPPPQPDPRRTFGNQAVLRSLGGVIQRKEAGDGVLTHYEKQKVYSYEEGTARKRWIDAFKIDFLKGTGFEIFEAARTKGYSTFGALFIVAHASLESGYGAGNWASETHNYFSVMGGSNKKYKGSHGTLAVYADAAASFDAYLALLGQKDRWPKTVEKDTGLYYLSSFTPDDVNQAFRQEAYYAKGGYAYNADPASDYGAVLFERMKWIGGPLVVLVSHMVDAEPADSKRKPVLQAYLEELRTAYVGAGTKLSEHRAAKKKAKATTK